jgi:hypothetical protein
LCRYAEVDAWEAAKTARREHAGDNDDDKAAAAAAGRVACHFA